MRTHKLSRIIVYTFVIIWLVSCMNYYKVSKSPLSTSTPDTVIQSRTGDSYTWGAIGITFGAIAAFFMVAAISVTSSPGWY